jgi:hypothetical protein
MSLVMYVNILYDGEFLDQLNNYQILKNSASWSQSNMLDTEGYLKFHEMKEREIPV